MTLNGERKVLERARSAESRFRLFLAALAIVGWIGLGWLGWYSLQDNRKRVEIILEEHNRDMELVLNEDRQLHINTRGIVACILLVPPEQRTLELEGLCRQQVLEKRQPSNTGPRVADSEPKPDPEPEPEEQTPPPADNRILDNPICASVFPLVNLCLEV